MAESSPPATPNARRPLNRWVGLLMDWGFALVVLFLVIGVWNTFFAPAPKSGGEAPAFSLQRVGSADALASSALPADKPVVLNFWFTSCGPCRAEIPELAKFHTENPEIAMYGISIDQMPPARLLDMSKRLGINYDVLHDPTSETAERFGVTAYPTTFVLLGGEIKQVHLGGLDRKALADMVDHAAR